MTVLLPFISINLIVNKFFKQNNSHLSYIVSFQQMSASKLRQTEKCQGNTIYFSFLIIF